MFPPGPNDGLPGSGEPYKAGPGFFAVLIASTVGLVIGGVIGWVESNPNEILGDVPLWIGLFVGGVLGFLVGLAVVSVMAFRRWRADL